VALALVWREDPCSVFALLRTVGLVLAAVAHVLPMLAIACDWQRS
jgi:glycosyltransferase 2 family protein